MRWTVYVDESGTHDASPIVVMGAVAATASQWQIFDKQWGAVLEREQLPYIHYVDLVGRRKQLEATRRLNRNSPLGILFRATASFLPSYIADARLDDRPEIDFVYEAGATNTGNIAQLYQILKTEAPPEWGERLGTLNFAEKGRARGLELADGVSFASLRQEREEHGDSPTLIEVSSRTVPDDARPPAHGTIPFRLPISRRNLTDLKDSLLLTRRSVTG